MAEHNELGKWGEDEATLYLENEGYVVIDSCLLYTSPSPRDT